LRFLSFSLAIQSGHKFYGNNVYTSFKVILIGRWSLNPFGLKSLLFGRENRIAFYNINDIATMVVVEKSQITDV
jgi:hypothetical protein